MHWNILKEVMKKSESTIQNPEELEGLDGWGPWQLSSRPLEMQDSEAALPHKSLEAFFIVRHGPGNYNPTPRYFLWRKPGKHVST